MPSNSNVAGAVFYRYSMANDWQPVIVEECMLYWHFYCQWALYTNPVYNCIRQETKL